MKRWICKLFLAVVLCLLSAVPAMAAQQGSLLLTAVEKPVMLFLVADEQGIPTEAFAGVVEKLTQDDLTPAMAKKFRQHAKDHALSGQTAAANENKEIFFDALNEGWYLVCSTAEQSEFTPFLICIPMSMDGKPVYHVHAEPKVDTTPDPSGPSTPVTPEPNIPQTGAILWPKYLLLILGAVAIGAGLLEVIRGRENKYE